MMGKRKTRRNLYLDDDLYEGLRAEAEVMDRSMASIVEVLIAKFLEARRAKSVRQPVRSPR